MTTAGSRAPRRLDALSRDRILAAATAILDEEATSDAAPSFTLRTLMSRLSTGAGAIYHHVANMDELRAAAADDVLRRRLEDASTVDDATSALREVAVVIFEAIHEHAWLGAQLVRDPVQPAVLRMWKTIGTQLRLLGLKGPALSDAGSTLSSYILGSAAQQAAGVARLPSGMGRGEYLAQVAERLRELDPDPLVDDIASDVAEHDDREQFLAGVDIILRGIGR